mmetsp:Transcript_6201/g.10103  ORF Transcript_6201/g.10103 Transcript_6201/m.10103 type:complete len:88 (-) Transcript_6201:2-265(-)
MCGAGRGAKLTNPISRTPDDFDSTEQSRVGRNEKPKSVLLLGPNRKLKRHNMTQHRAEQSNTIQCNTGSLMCDTAQGFLNRSQACYV